MFEKFRLFPQRFGIATPASSEPARRTVWCVSSTFLALLVVERIGQIDPKAAVVSQNPPNLVENVQKVANEVIRMRFMAELAMPTIGPGSRRTVTSQQIEGRR